MLKWTSRRIIFCGTQFFFTTCSAVIQNLFVFRTACSHTSWVGHCNLFRHFYLSLVLPTCTYTSFKHALTLSNHLDCAFPLVIVSSKAIFIFDALYGPDLFSWRAQIKQTFFAQFFFDCCNFMTTWLSYLWSDRDVLYPDII